MSSGIFNPQNRFWQTLDHFADLLILSLLWLVCSLPLITAGAASAALYDAVARCVRGGEPLRGATGIGELGLRAGEAGSPWTVDLRVRGYVGEREGASFRLQGEYAF